MIWPPFSLSKLDSTGDTQETEKERQFADRRERKGAGEEPNQLTARKLGPPKIIQYSLAFF
jgi:hypothetical protein